MSDQDVLDSMIRGDPLALGELYDRFGPRAYAIACRVLVDPFDAEEIVQEAFLDLWRDATRYDARRASVLGWVIMLTRTRAIDRLRARQARDRAKELLQREPNAAHRSPEDVAATKESSKVVLQLLEQLPNEQRDAIELAYWEGLSQTDIAARTGTPLGTVKTRMRLGLSKLAQGAALASRA